MKTTMKSTLVAMSLAILALAFSGCESTGSNTGGGYHPMGNLKNPSMMRDSDMPARRIGTSAGEGSHQMGNIKSPSMMRDRDMPGR